MDTFRNKWSTKSEYFRLFLVCAFPVHFWAYINLLNDMPSMVLEMGVWRIMGVAAYVLVFALLESIFVFGLLLLISFVLPERLFGVKFVHVGTIFILTSSFCFLFIHLYSQWEIKSLSFEYWLALWVLIGLSVFLIAVYWLTVNQRVQKLFQSGIESLAVLSLAYISLDMVGLLVIIIRNIIAPL